MASTGNVLSLPLVSKFTASDALPLAMRVVALYWGQEIPENLVQQTKFGETQFIDAIHVLESHDFAVYTYESSLRDLKKKIDQRIPPIAIMPGIQGTVQHATVISGYESAERKILTYVPEPDTLGAVGDGKFEQEWSQDNSCVILIVPNEMKKIVEKDQMKFLASNRIYFEAEKEWQVGRIKEAQASLLNATKLEPTNPQIWCLLGSIYNDIGSSEAVNCYQRAIELNQRYYLAHRGLGNYYLKLKDYSKAEKHFTDAIAIHPFRFAPIYKNRAICEIELGHGAKAKQDLQTYLQQMPNAKDRDNIMSVISELDG